jgi:phosphotransferase system enzyme I (PtsP)
MLETLRRIVAEVNRAHDLDQALNTTAHRVKEEMRADVCSVYLCDTARGEHVLMATDGLNPEAVGKVRLPFGQGLIGLVRERAEAVNLDDAPSHPRYVFVSETGEARYHGFLGVPIIQHGEVLGVLVVRQLAPRRFSGDEVSFLFTLAAQLAGAITHAAASGELGEFKPETRGGVKCIHGLAGAPGVAIGEAVVVYPPADLDAVPDRTTSDPGADAAAFKSAVQAVRDEFRALGSRVNALLPREDHALFDAFALIAGSDSLLNKTIKRIEDGQWAQGALRDTIAEHATLFDSMEDPYLRERASDIRDIGRRILTRLQAGSAERRDYPAGTVLVGEEITAAQLAEVPEGRLAAVVSVRGSGSSHAAILARALGVPAVMGAADLPIARLDAKEIIVDGHRGRVCIHPTPAVREEFGRLARAEADLAEELKALKDLPATTPDGMSVPLYVNTGLLADMGPTLKSGADGIGLYRTEFPFMVRDRFPGEDEQCDIYRKVLAAYAPRPVTLRTLDIGGDKALPYFPVSEDNPFLGWRGIRITLDHPEIFLTQVRAMLRAAEGLGNLYLLLPMISTVGELEEAIALIGRASAELAEEGVRITRPPLGVMIEVPSAVYQAGALARRVDFLSIGSNDLTQYLLAVDRNNSRVAKLYDALHPAVLAAIRQVVEGAHAVGRPVSICGEMAGDPAAALLLLGMGLDSLSMSTASLPRVKWVIRSFTRARARRILDEALAMEDATTIRRLLDGALTEAGLGGLVSALA